MSRRRRALKREVLPDAKFGDVASEKPGWASTDACYSVAHLDTFPASIDDVDMVLEHGPYMFKRCVQVVAIDRRIVVAVLLRKAMWKISAAAGIPECAPPALLAKVD